MTRVSDTEIEGKHQSQFVQNNRKNPDTLRVLLHKILEKVHCKYCIKGIDTKLKYVYCVHVRVGTTRMSKTALAFAIFKFKHHYDGYDVAQYFTLTILRKSNTSVHVRVYSV